MPTFKSLVTFKSCGIVYVRTSNFDGFVNPAPAGLRCAASFVSAAYDKYASFLRIAPGGLRKGARLEFGAFY